MSTKRKTWVLIVGLLSVICCIGLLVRQAKRESTQRPFWRATPSTVVRFYYEPPDSYKRPALVFRVVRSDDHRVGTAPLAYMGARTPYILDTEMQTLVTSLAASGIAWHEAPVSKAVTPVPFDEGSEMEISIFFSDHPVEGIVKAGVLCDTLSRLDQVFSEPRVLWEFKLFRRQYGCNVVDFDRNAYPQHELD